MIRNRTKKDVDGQVLKIEESISSDYQRNLKGFEIAKLYFEVGALEAAKKYVEHYISVRESSAVAHKFKGKVLEALGNKERALVSFKRAHELDPSVSEVLITIARLQATLIPFDLDEARSWHAKAEKVAPNNSAVSKLYDTILYHENQVNGGAEEESPSLSDRSVIPTNFFSTPKTQTRRFPPRPSPERLSAQFKQLESKHESTLVHLDDRLNQLEEKDDAIIKLLNDVMYEVRQGKTISQNISTEMTLLKKDLKDRDELRMKDITSAVAATTAAVTSLQQQQLTPKDPEEDISLLKQRLKEAEKQATIQQAAFLQFATTGYGFGGVRPQGSLPGLGVIRPDMPVFPQTPNSQIKTNWLPNAPEPIANVMSNANSNFGTPVPPPMRQPVINNAPTNIVISSSDKIPVVGKDPVPTFSGSVTIPPEHRLGVRPLTIPISSPAAPVGSSHSFQINLPTSCSQKIVSPLKKGDEPAVSITTTAILSKIPDPIYSAVDTYSDQSFGNRQRQVSVNSTYTDDDEHDPCPDFKPIIPLPEEVDVVTGEEEEDVLFEERSKLYRFVDKEWKERGIGQLKILKHKATGKIRVIMRRDQTLKICANHHVLPEIKIEKMKNQDKAVTWSANDFSDEEVRIENFSARFKTPEQADKFLEAFNKAKKEVASSSPSKKSEPIVNKVEPLSVAFKLKPGSWECTKCYTRNDQDKINCAACQAVQPGKEAQVQTPEAKDVKTPVMSFGSAGGFSFKASPVTSFSTPTTNSGVFSTSISSTPVNANVKTDQSSIFKDFSFGMPSNLSTGFNFTIPKSEPEKVPFGSNGSKVETFSFGKSNEISPKVENSTGSKIKPVSDSENESYVEDEERDPCPDFKPIIPLPKEVEVVTGEEEEEILFEKRSKLFRFVAKEWKERGIGQLKILRHKVTKKVRVLMRRDQTLKVCANHFLIPEIKVERMKMTDNAVIWAANDFSDEEVKLEKFCAQLKTAEIATEFITAFDAAKMEVEEPECPKKPESKTENKQPLVESLGSLDKFKPKVGSWECPGCMCRNSGDVIECPACETIQPGKEAEAPKKDDKPPVLFGSVGKSGFTFGGIPSSTTPSKGFVFGNNNTSYEPPTKVVEEVELSFENKSLKLNSAEDAKEVADKISSAKAMHILTLSGNTIGIEAAKALGKALETHPEFRRAHWKDMFTGRMKTEIPPALSHLSNGIMTANAQLVELDLSDNAFGPIGMEGLKDLLKSKVCYSLKELKLNNTGCGVTGGEYLADLLTKCLDNSTAVGHPLALRVFVLGRSRQENKGAIALARVFKRMKSLEEVSMPQNGIYHEGIAALMDAFSNNSNLRILNMNDNTFTSKGAESLAKALPSMSNLEVLNVGDCLLKTEGAIKIAKVLQNGHTNLKELHMDSNEILEEGGLSIVDAIANKDKLTTLSIDGNQFGEEGCENILNRLREAGKGGLISEFEDDQDPDDDEDEEEVSSNEDNKDETKEEPPTQVETTQKTDIFGGKPNIFSSLNGSNTQNLFGASNSNESGPGKSNIFGTPVFGNVFSSDKKEEGSPASESKVFSFGAKAADTEGIFPSSNLPSFATLSDKNKSIFSFGNRDESFTFEGTDSTVFGRNKSAKDASRTEDPDESEHDPYFEPVIPLPELVEVNTGEEEEKTVFSHRAKVYRYDSSTKEWKERGVGDIKILHHEGRNTYRVLLRRDQILKIACNHLITEDMVLKPLATSETALCWFAMDFSEEESKLEQLAVKFKESTTRDKFKDVFEDCQGKLKLNTSIKKDTNVESSGDEEYDDYDEEEQKDSTLFSRACQLYEGTDEASGFLGDVILEIIFDDGLFRIHAIDPKSSESVCDHPILDHMQIFSEKKKTSWTGEAFVQDRSVERSFRAVFETHDDVLEFEDRFYEGRDRAFQYLPNQYVH